MAAETRWKHDSETMKNLNDQDKLAAIHFLKKQLAQGKALANSLLESLQLEQGIVGILTPFPLDPSQVAEFDAGHLSQAEPPQRPMKLAQAGPMIYPVVGSEEQLVKLVLNLLEKREDICLLGNSIARTGDPWLARAKSHVISQGSDIYHIITYADRTTAQIEQAIREAHQIPLFLGAVGQLPPSVTSATEKTKDVSINQLRNFAGTVKCLFVGAYDGEGFVVWLAGGAPLKQ